MSETRATIRTRVERIVGTAVTATVNDAIIDAHKEAVRRHNWRHMESSTTLTVSEGDTTFALPADFKSELNPEMGDDDGTGYRRMQKIIKNGIESRDTTDTGRPLLYRIWGGVGHLYAEADDDYSFPLEYYCTLPALTADSGAEIYTSKNNALLDEIYEFIQYRAIAAGLRRLAADERAVIYDNLAEARLVELMGYDDDLAYANQDLSMEMPG
jgi:hypothetical protein